MTNWKLKSLVLSLGLVLSLAACAGERDGTGGDTSANNAANNADPNNFGENSRNNANNGNNANNATDDVGGGNNTGTDDTGTDDTGTDVDPDTPDDTCDASEELCEGACVDTRVDSAHCGGCGADCDASQTCVDGGCVEQCAEAGTLFCDGACVSADDDPAYCGDCDTACDDGEVCDGGECHVVEDCNVEPCVGLTWCDTETGRCEPGCDADGACGDGGVCDLEAHTCGCADGLHMCPDGCALEDSPEACGPDCMTCPTIEGGESLCMDDQCVVQCDAGRRRCGGVCATCPDGIDPSDTSCEGTACVCTPACGDRTCGLDPVCGEPCGECEGDTPICDETAGICRSECLRTNDEDQIVVDVPSIALALTMTIDGASLTADNTSGADNGNIVLVNAATGADVFTWTSTNQLARSNVPYLARVTPGRYHIRYERQDYINDQDATGNWPINTNTFVRRDLEITEDGTVNIDITTAAVALTMTIDGEAVSSENTSASDNGDVVLVDPETGNELFTWTSTNQLARENAPYRARVIAGSYDVRYERQDYINDQDATGSWPINTNTFVRRDLEVTEDSEATINIPTVAVALNITLDSSAVSSGNTSASDNGDVVLVDPETGNELFTWTSTNQLARENAPYRARVIAGSYDVRYERQDYVNDEDATGNWPINTNTFVERALPLIADVEPDIDIPTVATALTMTIDGASLSDGNTSASDNGDIVLVDPETGNELFTWTSTNQLARGNAPYRARITPGSYDVRYERQDYVNNQDATGSWPINTNTFVRRGLDIDNDGSINIDIPTVAASLTMTIDGEEVSDGNTSASDNGDVVLIDPETGNELFTWTSTNQLARSNAPYHARVIAGSYDVRYERQDYVNNEDATGSWPINTNTFVERGRSIDADGEYVVDIATEAVAVTLTVNQSSLGNANTSASDNGDVVLVDPETGNELFTWTSTNQLSRENALYRARVLVGRYNVSYDRQDVINDGDASGSWPYGQGVVLACFDAE